MKLEMWGIMKKIIFFSFWMVSGITVLIILTKLKLNIIPSIFVFLAIFFIIYFITNYINISPFPIYSMIIMAITTIASVYVYLFNNYQFNASRLNYLQGHSEHDFNQMMYYENIKNISIWIGFTSLIYLILLYMYTKESKKDDNNLIKIDWSSFTIIS